MQACLISQLCTALLESLVEPPPWLAAEKVQMSWVFFFVAICEVRQALMTRASFHSTASVTPMHLHVACMKPFFLEALASLGSHKLLHASVALRENASVRTAVVARFLELRASSGLQPLQPLLSFDLSRKQRDGHDIDQWLPVTTNSRKPDKELEPATQLSWPKRPWRPCRSGRFRGEGGATESFWCTAARVAWLRRAWATSAQKSW